ncbi:alpha-mannosidase [Asanoa siamensis]|uniref:Alpha-mannosidase n=1 Tax=Asanoa siamensis TaxID=926357 RepID=A0ABQ4D4N7_9ACTN|nr:glycoside hydrolase family 38 C-terminal domain-containing protein [Asanoa siamensis]GIF78471.1 alpha-mannosidase [Asanoa siamensis]
MHDDRTVVEDRLARLLSDRLRPAVHQVVGTLDVAAWPVDGEPVPPAVALAEGTFAPFPIGTAWGPPWSTTWFHLTGTVPQPPPGTTAEIVVDLGWNPSSPGFQAEGLVYGPDGEPRKGLHPRNDWIPVSAGPVDLYVEAAANPTVLVDFRPTPLGDPATAGDAPLYRLVRADVTFRHEQLAELVHDLEVLAELRAQLPVGEPRGHEILRALSRAMDALDPADLPGTAAAARVELAGVLARPAHASAHRITAVGHAHIDTAWLWPQRETVRKVARTAANVADLLDTHPDLVYAMSSAQQFAWLEEFRPEVFRRVRTHVQQGRFVPVGGMWVESDTNLPGSEALARQFVHGKRWFLETFGIETREAWLPDSFGYSAALPQIVKLSGTRWFLTQKISWNQTNRFPHHTFWWEGIDGTRVFTHFPPADTYNGELTGAEVAHAVRNFRDKGDATRSLLPFGHGDGGGGPTREMLARARRLSDLEGAPRVAIEAPATFFAAAEEEYGERAPVWVGELYLELHRATYTSHAAMKQGNRRAEHLLREAELWCTTATVRSGVDYPYETLDDLWKRVLLHQFHDILPGSSIAWVHREARDTYVRVAALLELLIADAMRRLAGPPAAGEVSFNAAPFARDGLPALGAGHPPPIAGAVHAEPLLGGGWILDNGLLRVTVDARGLLVSVLDLVAGREVLAGPANLPQLHRDEPNRWDAWDVDPFYRDLVTDVDGVTDMSLADGTVRVSRTFGASTMLQEITLPAGARRVDFRVEVDWHEREKFLKMAFPIDVHTDRARFETQYGHLSRPTHENTSWDAARFEVCAHRWVRVAEPGYGVALANDSTYGHDVRRVARPAGGTSSTVRLSLLRAPRFPDPETDQGRHTMRYALVPGATVADAVRAGYEINLPARTTVGSPVAPLLRVTADPPESVVVEALKLADDRSGDVVVRVYEALGGRASARLEPDFPVAAATETDLLERDLERDALRDGLTLSLRPFQIATIRLRRA